MSTRFFYSTIIFACTLTGIVFFLVQRNWLVIHWSYKNTESHTGLLNQKEPIAHKKIVLYYWKDEKFKTESTSLLWDTHNPEGNLKLLIKSWLTCLAEEKVVTPALTLESIALSSNDTTAYLSFNQSILSKEWSIFKKWQLIESLFKTLRAADLSITTVVFLVQNEPMQDDHIDFSQPLPTAGYLK
jgi:hypothetical protein